MDRHRASLSARAWRALTLGLPLAFLALFFAYPLAAIVERGLRGAGESPIDVLADPLTREVVWFTIWQALASTVLTIAVALPAAYVLGRYRFRGRNLVGAVVVIPFVLPTVVVALAFLAILPDRIEHGWAPILIAHAFFNVAVIVRIVGTFWATLDPRLGEAAAVLGAPPLARLREITVPLLAPALAAAAAIVFLFSFTSFGVVLILGGPQYATIETEIYNQAVRLFDLRAAAVLSIVQLACVAAAVWVATRLERRLAPGPLRSERDTLRRPRTTRERLVVALGLGGLAAFAVARSHGRLVDGLVLLPLGASAVMLGLGFLVAFDTDPVDFRAAPWLVPVAQALVAIPFVVRIVAPALRSIDPRQREAAALLGASPRRVRLEVDLPIVSRSFTVAAGFAFAISLGEFGATVFLARPDRPTLPVAIFRFLGRPGEVNIAQAYALAVVLMAVTVVAVLLVERVRVHRGGWF